MKKSSSCRITLLIIAIALPAIFMAYFINSKYGVTAAVVNNPHGNYAPDTTMCGYCHSGHNALSFSNLILPTQRETCYTCHDGSKSSINVKSQFGETIVGSSVYNSYHPVPSGGQVCTDCHDAHLAPGATPRLLAIGAGKISSGNAACGVCHGTDSTLPYGDMVSAFVYTPHDTDMNNPASGTGIKCSRCHQPHGSPYKPLLRQNITDQNGLSQAVTGNNNTVCFGCHTEGLRNFKGLSAYNASRHGSTLSSTVALTVYPGTPYAPGMCMNCHEPHGKTGIADYKRAADNDLCIKCHDDSAVIRPPAYSYRGITVYNSIPHAAATSPAGLVSLYKSNSQGFAAWQSAGSQTPSTAGTATGSFSSLLAKDNSRLITDLTATQGIFNTQMFKFKVTEPIANINELRFKWTGYGEPTVGHPTELSIWNRTFNSGTGGWEKYYSQVLGTEGTVSTAKPNAADYINAAGEVYFLAGAMHDATGPIISALSAQALSTSSLRVSWNTSETAKSWVDYGTTTAYGTTVANAAYKTAHSIDLTGLTKHINYHYRVRSEDVLGNQTASADLTFELSDPPPVPTLVPKANIDTTGPVNVSLTWNTVDDPNGDPVQYQVEVSGQTSP